MTRTVRHLLPTLTLAGALCASACSGSSQNPAAPTVTTPALPAVIPATVSAVQVTSAPSSGQSFQLSAVATSTDGGAQDVTRTATWLSSDVNLATVTPLGAVSVMGTGHVIFSATFQGVTGSVGVNVLRPALFTLRGVVRDATLLPVEGARVESLSGTYAYALSDVSGKYVLTDLSAGETIIEVTRTGYDTWSQRVVVTQDMSLDVSMTSAVSGTSARR